MSEYEHRDIVTITVNHHLFESPEHTTGAALYALGGIAMTDTLYREMPDRARDDEPVPRDGVGLHVKEGEKFYSEPGKPKKEVEIVIDSKHLESPSQTTGSALYVLGQVAAGYTLYRETEGPEEDPPVANDATAVHVHKHEKFYSSLGQVTPGAWQ
jgi:hypothetical protein